MLLSYIRFRFFPTKEEKLFSDWYKSLKKASVDWNIKVLKENTEEMQLRKILEELRETLDAKTHQERIEEKADVLIAIFGLARFDERMSLTFEELFIKFSSTEFKEILIEANNKINTLWERTYIKKNGVYKHIIQ